MQRAVGSVTIRDVSHSFTDPDGRPVEVLQHVDLDIEPGSFVCLVGPSGCGKSTLLRILAGFLSPTTGEVRVGASLVRAPSHERGVVFQQPPLYPWLSVLDNVALGPRIRGVPREERRRVAREHLELVGLADEARFRPYELSGGMQQRVQLARVLANDPSIILMDEPFAALDAITRDRMQDELLRIWRAKTTTVFFITHSVAEAAYLGTRTLVMSARPGRIVFDEATDLQGRGLSPTDVRHSPQFSELTRRLGDMLQESHTVD